jgi:hypothetical protein
MDANYRQGWRVCTTAWMQEVEQRMEQLPRKRSMKKILILSRIHPAELRSRIHALGSGFL